MNLIREVKERVDILKVAEAYGLKFDRTYKCRCPFHRERTASLSISPQKQIWKCFGCGKGGDVISLVSELMNINALEVAKSINYNLGLGLDLNQKTTHFEINKYQNKKQIEEMFKEWENKTFGLLCDYLHLLWKWEKTEEFASDLYVEAMHNKDYVDNVIDDIFLNGTDEDKIWFLKYEKRWIKKIEARVRTFRPINK